MKRRSALKLLGALGASSMFPTVRAAKDGYDVVVVGAGVFGTWTAAHLARAGKRVAVIDMFGPAHSGASSGGESRVTRCGYGSEELYAEWACRSISEWKALSDRAALPLFHPMGVLWVHKAGNELVDASGKTLKKLDVPFELLDAKQLRRRYPVMEVADDERGFLEPRGGGLMARRAVQQLAAELQEEGVDFLHGEVLPMKRGAGDNPLASLNTLDDGEIRAEQYVLACGPWLELVCPEAMRDKLFVTRQEVLYFGVEAGATGDLPVWADLPFYGLPSLEGRGFKVANDTHGQEIDMIMIDRRPSEESEATAREFLARRFPSLAKAPLSEARVCQYENSSNGDFIIDRHPRLSNVWIAGGGSGHGFKHGPALGEHLAGLVLGTQKPIERFSLASKQTAQERAIQ